MIEYHSWLTIKISEDGENEDNVDEVLTSLYLLGEELFITNEKIHFSNVNGLRVIHLYGAHNRIGDTLHRLYDFMKNIIELAPGSYGVTYIWDDESKNDNNAFVLYVLKRGKIVRAEDENLSPCNPVIEV